MEAIRKRMAGDPELFPPHAMRGGERPRIGPLSDLAVGQTFNNRQELSVAHVHRPTVAGIWGGYIGAYSVVVSGGYDDDLDEGETVIYTGAGGRGKDDEGTYGVLPAQYCLVNQRLTLHSLQGNKPQTEDQTFKHDDNRALQKSAERKTPVRVIRKLSTSTGGTYYRYDGLYDVTSAELKDGKSGYKICQFKFKRQEGQAPLPQIGPPDAIPFSATGRRGSRSSRSADPQ
ncbi:hypothetical protein EWM64_g7284 [Hericium alpestre]|uniref:YDG domain-containing protein n=1 Tax=Hericium alpestre TaxID=135208 RepID=A0A4Y9ZPA9_9AGAM|nr:hypothetical protein EWM64_g7284 [Hericium alpestre]